MQCSRSSARVASAWVAPGVIEASYYGLITPQLLPGAYRQVVCAVNDERAAVVRTDTSLMTLDGWPEIAPLSAPVALVVSPDQFEFWMEWAAMVARKFGQVRTVFLPHHLELARRWAEDRALVAASRSRPCTPSRRRLCQPGMSACRTSGQSPGLPA
jgi:hypothetical protein